MSFSMQSAWEMILNAEQFSQSDISKTIRLQYQSWKSTQHLGPGMPLALYPGQKAIEPFIFTTAAEALENMSGRLISERA